MPGKVLVRSKIYDELGWETLSDRRKGRRVLLINKIINNNTPSYLNEKLPPFCREMFSGSIRTTFHAIRCKTYRYMNSFFPDAIASWNLFMENFNYKVIPSLSLLKHDISLIRPESKHFFKIHDPTGLRYLFQLRLRLSPLKGHKYCHKFLDIPSGNCHCNQGIDDTSHFLLSCPSYTIQRARLVTSVKEILLKVKLNSFRRPIGTVADNKIHKGNPAFLNLGIAYRPTPTHLPLNVLTLT